MEINCQNCNNIYIIDYAMLLPSGKKVRCKSCGYIWVQLPNFQDNQELEQYSNHTIEFNESKILDVTENLKIENSKSDINQENQIHYISNKELLSRPKTNKKRLFYINIMILIVFTLLASPLFQDFFPIKVKKLYRHLELYSTKNISLIDPEIQYLKKNTQTTVVIKGSIKNFSRKEKLLPNLYAIFYTQNKQKLLSKKILDKIIFLKYEQDYKFEITLFSVPENTDFITIKLGGFF